MAIEQVRAQLALFDKEGDIREFDGSSATVELAAERLGVEPRRIAKTLAFDGGDGTAILVVAAGDARIDNKKFKAEFGRKAAMLPPDAVRERTGHAVGGVCPFGLPEGTAVYTDVSLRKFPTVFPACGSANSAIELTPDEVAQIGGSRRWVDVTKAPLSVNGN